MSTSKSKTRTTIKYVAGLEGGPRLCGFCKKAVAITGSVLAVLVLGGLFMLLSILMKGTPVMVVLAVTLLCAAAVTVVFAVVAGIPFAVQRSKSRGVARGPKVTHPDAVICDGCKYKFLPSVSPE
jgi:hypothetical protein